MYEFEVLLTDGTQLPIQGYTIDDAKRRNPEIGEKVVAVLFREYID